MTRRVAGRGPVCRLGARAPPDARSRRGGHADRVRAARSAATRSCSSPEPATRARPGRPTSSTPWPRATRSSPSTTAAPATPRPAPAPYSTRGFAADARRPPRCARAAGRPRRRPLDGRPRRPVDGARPPRAGPLPGPRRDRSRPVPRRQAGHPRDPRPHGARPRSSSATRATWRSTSRDVLHARSSSAAAARTRRLAGPCLLGPPPVPRGLPPPHRRAPGAPDGRPPGRDRRCRPSSSSATATRTSPGRASIGTSRAISPSTSPAATFAVAATARRTATSGRRPRRRRALLEWTARH